MLPQFESCNQIGSLDCLKQEKRAYNFPTLPSVGRKNIGITSDNPGHDKAEEKNHRLDKTDSDAKNRDKSDGHEKMKTV